MVIGYFIEIPPRYTDLSVRSVEERLGTGELKHEENF
jgi:hypothetical protein